MTMNAQWLRDLSLKKKLGILTVILMGIVMISVGYIVIRQQRETLELQMKGTGSFLTMNLAKNVVTPLLAGDRLGLSSLVATLEAGDQGLQENNPARFTQQEYQAFLSRYLLEEKVHIFEDAILIKGENVYIEPQKISAEQRVQISTEILNDVLHILQELDSPQQYETFLETYPWTKTIVESLALVEDSDFMRDTEHISDEQQADFIQQIQQRVFDEIIRAVRNPFIGYAIIVDKDGIIRAHPDIDEFVGKQYVWPEGTSPLEEHETLKVQHCLFKGEPHYDFAAPVIIRDKNLGAAQIGMVHVGLREAYISQNIQAAKQRIIFITVAALLLGSAGAYLLAALIVKPIKRLALDAEVLGGGDLDHQIESRSHDEVGTLATTLDETRIKLKNAQEQLIVNERLARELEIAREIQMTLLPKETPSLDSLEIGTLYRSAAQVGGDLYDFFWVSEDELGIVVADVSGKGVPGSLVMTMAKAIIRAKAMRSEGLTKMLPVRGDAGDPASVIKKTNRMIFPDIKRGMFITANYGVLNVKTLTFSFVSAGHNDTMVYNSQTGELVEYNPKGIALGLDKGTMFDAILGEQALELSSGDLVIQYTDGISEAMNEEREEYGEERFKAAIRKYAHQNVKEFLASIDQEIRAFTEGYAQSDDITAVAIKVK